MGEISRLRWWVLAGLVAMSAAAVYFLFGRGGPVTPDTALGPPVFVAVGESAGIDHSYTGDFEFFVGGGVAVFDCNDDELADLFLAGGSSAASLYVNRSEVGGELRFEYSTAIGDITDVLGAYPLDIDSDTITDLVVLRLGENLVYRGLGGCAFARANEEWNIDGGNEWTAAFSAKWEEGNQLPTLAFGNYLDWPVDREQVASCADNYLIRPEGDRYGTRTALKPSWCTLSVLFADWDGSGRLDLRVANDRHYYVDGSEQMWRVASGEEPRLYTEADGWVPIEIWGMGIAVQDVTDDGYPEFFITSQGDNKLATLEAGPGVPTYNDIAIRWGVTAHRPFTGDEVLPSTGWHPEFQDVNNDGFVDLLITKGNVEAMPEYAMADPNNLLIGQPDGTFAEGAVDAGVASMARSRGAALVDLNLDGMLDLVVVNRVEDTQVWRNTGPAGNWLGLQLRQTGVNQDAVGARLEVTIGDHVLTRDVLIGGGHAGDQLGWVHIGLGESPVATVRVRWPDGATSEYKDVPANRFVVLDRDGSPQFLEEFG